MPNCISVHGIQIPLYTPPLTNGTAEWNITYTCDLACITCQKLSFLPAKTRDMTERDATDFINQCVARNWKPRIILIGGEPTLHKDVFQFIEIAHRFNPGHVEIWSNGYSNRAKRVLQRIQSDGKCCVRKEGWKTSSIVHSITDYFLAPVDFGETRKPCGVHSSNGGCGISVDSEGYTICPIGGTIASWLKLPIKTKVLNDLFDPVFALNQTTELCKYCGCFMGVTSKKLTAAHLIRGTLMSKTWVNAVQNQLRSDSLPRKR